jgi:hypothetical protein
MHSAMAGAFWQSSRTLSEADRHIHQTDPRPYHIRPSFQFALNVNGIIHIHPQPFSLNTKAKE